nr:MAG TPA: hypothetical protein [Caudoviricetes sp.]
MIVINLRCIIYLYIYRVFCKSSVFFIIKEYLYERE